MPNDPSNQGINPQMPPDMISGGGAGGGMQNNPAAGAQLQLNPALLANLAASQGGQMPSDLRLDGTAAPQAQPPIEAAPSSILDNKQYSQAQIDALQKQKQAFQDEANNQNGLAQDQIAIQKKAMEDDAQRAIENQAIQAKAMSDAQARSAEIRSSIDKSSAEEVDPDRYWNSKSTGGKVMAGIGILLSGIGMGIAHHPGENPAMQLLQQSIDRDIDAQKGHMENNWKRIRELHGLDDTASNIDLHNIAWKQNAQEASWQRVKYELATRSAMSTSETVKNNAAQGIQDITLKQDNIAHQRFLDAQRLLSTGVAQRRELMKQADKDVQELIKEKGVDPVRAANEVYSRPLYRDIPAPPAVQAQRALEAQAQKQANTEAREGKPGLIGPVSPQQAAQDVYSDPAYRGLKSNHEPIVPESGEGKGKSEADLRERSLVFNGKIYQAPDKEMANKFREDMDHISHANALINQVLSARADGGEASPTKTKELNGKIGLALNEINELSGVNRMNPGEMDQIREALPTDANAYNTWWRADPSAQLKNVQGILNTKIEGSLNSFIGSTGGTSTYETPAERDARLVKEAGGSTPGPARSATEVKSKPGAQKSITDKNFDKFGQK